MDTADWTEDDEWELINDDGFVYKRKKRRFDPTAASASASTAPDPAAEEKNRRERKKMALIRIKMRYQKEIDQWEHLSNTLKTMQELTRNQQQRQEIETSIDPSMSSPLLPAQSSDSTNRRIVDDLLIQVEAQEAIIRDASNLCDVAEAMCDSQLERTKRSFIDLPIWAASPRELLASLCED
ncbi:unnamed protein product [Ilex paraguariensis]|uniref:Uncharacterized protein n=1 Tax=Ilex paraguariensis TaxID=185542 RepID=A0ABC8UHK5_9AQUA